MSTIALTAFAAIPLVLMIFLITVRYFALRHINRTPPSDVIYNTTSNLPYVSRWLVFPFSNQEVRFGKWTSKIPIGVFIQKFSDIDHDLPHNHMGWSLSLAIDGFGTEYEWTNKKERLKTRTIVPFRVRLRSPKMKHTLDSMPESPLVTIFIFQVDMDAPWGFWSDCGRTFIPYNQYKGTKTFVDPRKPRAFNKI